MKKPQTLSLQEQLLKSGLASEAKARQARSDKRKQDRQQRHGAAGETDGVRQDLEQARRQQAERDRELNRQRHEVDERRAVAGQVRQLAEFASIAEDAQGVAYRFSDADQVKCLYVSARVRQALIAGQAGIVRVEELGYRIVPAEVAGKIRDRDAGCIVVLNETAAAAAAADDPYAAFQVPDDLIW